MNDDERRNDDEARARPDPLTHLLRNADPAAGDPGLNPNEVVRMRRAITAAALEDNDPHRAPIAWPAWMQPLRMRPAWMRPALALAAIGIVALGLWTLAGQPPAQPAEPVADAGAAPTPPAEPSVVNPGQPSAIPHQPAVIPDDPAVSSDRPAVSPDQPVAATSDPQTMPVPAPSPGEALAATVAATNDPSPPNVRARTVQFTAPRGTRIIWTLDPDFESPIAGREARQEQGE